VKKILFFTVLMLALLITISNNTSYAGNAATYKMTVQSIQLKKSDGTWVTIAQPNQEIDIASVSAGATAASLLSDAPIPVGQYVNFKMVFSETMKFSGSDGAHYTVAGSTVTVNGDNAGLSASTATWTTDPPANTTLDETNESHSATEPAGGAGEVTAVLNLDKNDADNYIEVYRGTDLATPISITADSAVTMFFDFDTQGTINYIDYGGTNDIMFFSPPQEGTQFQITVDGTTSTLSESQMQVDF
jgi:hypothetical protein